MGFSHVTLFRSLTILILLFSINIMAQTGGIGTSAAMEDFALPEYKKGGGELQYIVYGKKAQNLGAFINISGPILDVVRKGTDIFSVKQLLGQKLYPFGSDAKTVAGFWNEFSTSDAILSTESAVYDKKTKILRGDEVVELRSRELDMQGVGFDADFNKRIIHIREKVKVIIRSQERMKDNNSENKKSTEKK